MKKVLSSMALLLSIFSVGSCGNKENKDNKNSALMVMDINPSVEFVIDAENKVASVTALNDDGAIILSGEVLIGLPAEQAAEKIISISIETGYLSKDDAKDITFTLSGTSVDKLYNNVTSKVSNYVKEKNIDSKIKQGKALAEEEIKKLLLEANPTLTEEDIKSFTVNEALTKISESRQEYAKIATEELREAYLSFKNSKIEFAENEQTAEVIEKLGSTYEELLSSYRNSLTKIDEASKALKDAYSKYLLDENSEYQKAVSKVKETRLQYVSVKNAKNAEELLNVLKGESFEEVTGVDTVIIALDSAIKLSAIAPDSVTLAYTEATETILPILDGVISVAENTLDTAKKLAEGFVNTATSSLSSIKAQLTTLEENFPSDIKEALKNNAVNLENAINDAKDSAFASFEQEYSTAIAAINKSISDQKEALKNAVNNQQ